MSGTQLTALDRSELGRVAPNYEAMRQAIELCQRVDEIADFANKAVAIQAYCRQSLDVENEMHASRIRLRAERRLGQLLKLTAENGERATRETARLVGSSDAARRDQPTLADLGVPRDRASRAMQLANIPEEQFEAALAEPLVAQPRRILREAKPPKPPRFSS
jgi:hypothetical protein